MPERSLPGFRDFYPEELAERTYIMSVWRDVMRRFGFVEYDGPPLEPLDMYRRKSGEEIVAQLYAFTDKGGRDVALRPEMTPTFARMVSARANALRKPVRWFSIPQLFRYERQQKGRLREHFQLNADIVGEAAVSADAELLACALAVLEAFGFAAQDVRARVSDRRLLDALLIHAGAEPQALPRIYAVLDKRGREPKSVSAEKLVDAAGSPDLAANIETILNVRNIDDLAVAARDASLNDHLSRMREYFAHVAAAGYGDWVQLDMSIVRGLAYYTGVVFELFDSAGEFRAICGGGRYDRLLHDIGGVDLPALGFGMGDVVLGEFLRSRNMLRGQRQLLDFWIAGDDDALHLDVVSVASELRRRKASVEYSLRSQPLSRQLKSAANAGARRAVLLKRDAWSARNVTVRDLASGSESVVTFADLIDQMQQGGNG